MTTPKYAEAFARHRFALALLFAIALTIFIGPLVRREVFTLRDHFDYFQPLRLFTAEELQAGRLPLWNPWSASGEPWFANPQTGVFYPPSWLFLLLPFATAYMLFLLVHLVVLGWGAYLLFARWSSSGAAMAAAAALMVSGPVLSLLDVNNNLATLAWVPLALWCAAEGAWLRGGVALTLAFLGGEPFFAAFAALLYVVVRRRRDVLLTGAVALGLSAVQLFPFVEFVLGSDRTGGMEDASVLRHSMSAADWLRVVVPRAGFKGGQEFIPVAYVGVVTLLLAIVAVVVARRRKDVLAWMGLIAVAVVIGSGPALLAQLPVTLFRYPARLLPFAALGVCALAAIGWNRLRPEKRWADLLLVLVLVADLLPRAMPLLESAPFRRDVVPYPASVGATGKILRFGEVDARQRGGWIAGYLNLYDRRFDEFTAAPLTSAPYVAMHRRLLQSPTFAEFARAGVFYIISPYALPRPWSPVMTRGTLRLYANETAWPMAAHFVPGSPAMRHARWSVDTRHARVTVNAAADGMLVLRQQAGPGWSVTVDGRRAEPLVVEEIFRGVAVPAGKHEVVWTYLPASFQAGAVMTCVTLLSIIAARFVKRRG